MTTTTETAASVEVPRATEFTEAEHAMLDAMNVPAARVGRALLFREVQRTGLDPFAKHLYLREDWNEKAKRAVYTVASTIDGFRIVAKRQPTYEGQTAPQWCGKDGKWVEVWAADAAPIAARIGVYVRGYREPMWGIARFSEYKPSGNGGFMWTKMAAHMVAKVAESLAIRKAYPDLLSGIYTDDEMAQSATAGTEGAEDAPERPAQRQRPTAPVEDEWTTPEVPPAMATPAQISEILNGLTTVRGITEPAAKGAAVSAMLGREISNVSQITAADAASILATLYAEAKAKLAPSTPATGFTPDNPGITRPQSTMLHATFGEKGITDRADKLEFASRVVGRTVESSDHLTKAEASRVIDALNTGEIPPTPPNPDGAQGFDAFSVLDQMVSDVANGTDDADAHEAISEELEAGRITAADAELLRERLASPRLTGASA